MAAAAASGAPVVIMHMQGTRNYAAEPYYNFAPVDIYEFLDNRVKAAVDAGIPRSAIAVDPGFGLANLYGIIYSFKLAVIVSRPGCCGIVWCEPRPQLPKCPEVNRLNRPRIAGPSCGSMAARGSHYPGT